MMKPLSFSFFEDRKTVGTGYRMHSIQFFLFIQLAKPIWYEPDRSEIPHQYTKRSQPYDFIFKEKLHFLPQGCEPVQAPSLAIRGHKRRITKNTGTGGFGGEHKIHRSEARDNRVGEKQHLCCQPTRVSLRREGMASRIYIMTITNIEGTNNLVHVVLVATFFSSFSFFQYQLGEVGGIWSLCFC